jgi:hypothetical protein
VNFTILSKDVMKGEIIVRLFFEDPSKISATNDLDILQVTVKEEIDVQREDWMTLLKK